MGRNIMSVDHATCVAYLLLILIYTKQWICIFANIRICLLLKTILKFRKNRSLGICATRGLFWGWIRVFFAHRSCTRVPSTELLCFLSWFIQIGKFDLLLLTISTPQIFNFYFCVQNSLFLFPLNFCNMWKYLYSFNLKDTFFFF
jgi:hypothetical protein